MEKHHLLQAVTGDAVVFGKNQQVVNAGVMGLDKIVLELEAVFVAGCGLINRLQLTFIQQLAGFNGVPDKAFKFDLGQRDAVHASAHIA